MVKLRVLVRVIPEDAYIAHLESARPPALVRGERKFYIVVPDPENWFVGTLAVRIKTKYQSLYKYELGQIKYLKDNDDDCDLDPEERVSDLLVNEGRALTDKSDQYVTIKVIQEQGRAIRDGSVIPDLTPTHYQLPPRPQVPRFDQVPRFEDVELSLGKRKAEDEGIDSHRPARRRRSLAEIEGGDTVVASIEKDHSSDVVVQNSQPIPPNTTQAAEMLRRESDTAEQTWSFDHVGPPTTMASVLNGQDQNDMSVQKSPAGTPETGRLLSLRAAEPSSITKSATSKRFIRPGRDLYALPESDIDDSQILPQPQRNSRITPRLISSSKPQDLSTSSHDTGHELRTPSKAPSSGSASVLHNDEREQAAPAEQTNSNQTTSLKDRSISAARTASVRSKSQTRLQNRPTRMSSQEVTLLNDGTSSDRHPSVIENGEGMATEPLQKTSIRPLQPVEQDIHNLPGYQRQPSSVVSAQSVLRGDRSISRPQSSGSQSKSSGLQASNGRNGSEAGGQTPLNSKRSASEHSKSLRQSPSLDVKSKRRRNTRKRRSSIERYQTLDNQESSNHKLEGAQSPIAADKLLSTPSLKQLVHVSRLTTPPPDSPSEQLSQTLQESTRKLVEGELSNSNSRGGTGAAQVSANGESGVLKTTSNPKSGRKGAKKTASISSQDHKMSSAPATNTSGKQSITSISLESDVTSRDKDNAASFSNEKRTLVPEDEIAPSGKRKKPSVGKASMKSTFSDTKPSEVPADSTSSQVTIFTPLSKASDASKAVPTHRSGTGSSQSRELLSVSDHQSTSERSADSNATRNTSAASGILPPGMSQAHFDRLIANFAESEASSATTKKKGAPLAKRSASRASEARPVKSPTPANDRAIGTSDAPPISINKTSKRPKSVVDTETDEARGTPEKPSPAKTTAARAKTPSGVEPTAKKQRVPKTSDASSKAKVSFDSAVADSSSSTGTSDDVSRELSDGSSDAMEIASAPRASVVSGRDASPDPSLDGGSSVKPKAKTDSGRHKVAITPSKAGGNNNKESELTATPSVASLRQSSATSSASKTKKHGPSQPRSSSMKSPSVTGSKKDGSMPPPTPASKAKTIAVKASVPSKSAAVRPSIAAPNARTQSSSQSKIHTQNQPAITSSLLTAARGMKLSLRELHESVSASNSAANSPAIGPGRTSSFLSQPKKTILGGDDSDDSESSDSDSDSSSDSGPAKRTSAKPNGVLKTPAKAASKIPDPAIRDATDDDSGSD